MRRMSNFDEESEYQDFTEMQNRYDADRSRESRNFRYRNDETYDRCTVPRNHRAYDRPFYNFSSEVPHISHGIVVAITNLGSKSVSFTGSAHIKGDTNSLSDSIALLEPCLAVGGTTINYTECDSANITSITLEDCSITDAYLTAADWSVNATVTTDGTSSSDYGDNVSINYSYESSTGCSYTSLKVLLLNNVGEVLGYGIGFVNDVPAGENITGTMYAIAAPHSLDSLADMAMFSCPTLE